VAAGHKLGWSGPHGFQPPLAGLPQVKASQAFIPSLSKQGSFSRTSRCVVEEVGRFFEEQRFWMSARGGLLAHWD
jgi:hypothetical protein